MSCSCHAPMVYSADTYIGTQFFTDQDGDPYLVLALFNCKRCGSTRAAILFCSDFELEDELESERPAARPRGTDQVAQCNY